jgi:hypothetical protein
MHDSKKKYPVSLIVNLTPSHLPSSSSPVKVLSSILLLTDGRPNVIPPRGHVPMLKQYFDKNPNLKFTLNTFGFGYHLDSKLLLDLAVEGGGSYSFIPDSGFVGTVFVHALSNILATYGQDAKLSIALSVPIERVLGGGSPNEDMSDKNYRQFKFNMFDDFSCTLNIGSLQFDQAKTFGLVLSNPLPIGAEVHLSIDYYDSVRGVNNVTVQNELTTPPTSSNEDDDVNFSLFRLSAVDAITSAMNQYKIERDGPVARLTIKKLVDEMKSHLKGGSGVNVGGNTSSNVKIIENLLVDLSGQVTEAVSQDNWFNKWVSEARIVCD